MKDILDINEETRIDLKGELIKLRKERELLLNDLRRRKRKVFRHQIDDILKRI